MPDCRPPPKMSAAASRREVETISRPGDDLLLAVPPVDAARAKQLAEPAQDHTVRSAPSPAHRRARGDDAGRW